MLPQSAHFSPSPANHSAAARQLQQASPWLRFRDATLEQQFRHSQQQQSRQSVLTHLVLATLLALAIFAIDFFVLHRNESLLLQVMRFAIIISLLLCIVVTASGNWLWQYYSRVIQWVAPLIGVCIAINALINPYAGISFLPTVVLAIFGLYLLIGMHFVPALFSGAAVLATYLIGANYLDMPTTEYVFNGCILAFTNVIAATAAYTLEDLRRKEFLESRLLTEMVNLDGLTGIYNRRAFDEHYSRLWDQAMREQRTIALLLIDIDNFKAFNDCYGHQAGDHCLQKVAAVIAGSTRRPLDMSARYGGEEFAVLLHDVTREHVQGVVTNIQSDLQLLGLNNPLSKPTSTLTVSVGIAFVVPQKSRSSLGVVQLADEALYAAKAAGRNRVVIRDVEYADLSTGAFRNVDNTVKRLGL